MKHVLKCEQPFYDWIVSGVKNFEIRYNDRGYAAGDELELHPINDDGEIDLAECVTRTVTCMVQWFDGLREGYVVLGFDAARGGQ